MSRLSILILGANVREDVNRSGVCEQIEVPARSPARKVLRQSKILLQVRISERMCEQVGVFEVLKCTKISSQESVEAV